MTCFKKSEIRGTHSLSVIVFSERVARLYRLYIISAQSVQESPKLVQVCWQSSRRFPPSSLSASSKPILEIRCGKITERGREKALRKVVSSELTQQT